LVGSGDLATAMSWNGTLIAIGFVSGAVAVLDWQKQLFHRFSPPPSLSAIRQLSFQPSQVAAFSPRGRDDTVPLSLVDTQKVSSGLLSLPVRSEADPSTSPTSASVTGKGTNPTSSQNAQNNGAGASRDEPHGISPLQALIRPMVQQELSQLRQEMRASLAELQVDMMQQLQVQKEAFNRALSQHSQLVAHVLLENQMLRAQLGQLEPAQDRTPSSLEAASDTRAVL
jgi:predicted DNA-binding protein (UPF0251 family)